MTKFEKLTPEQEALLPQIRDEWLAHGLSTEPADRDRAEAGVAEAYRAVGLESPGIVIWLDSPMAGAIGAQMLPELLKAAGNQVRDQVRDQARAQAWDQIEAQVWAQAWAQVRNKVWDQAWDQVGAQVRAQVETQVRVQVGAQVRAQTWAQVGAQVGAATHGQHDAEWLGFYAAMGALGIDAPSKLHGLMEVSKSAGWWWPFEGAVILTDRPESIVRDAQLRLHSEDGPALRYRDGWTIYAWHGVRVPDDFHSWDIERALSDRNAEIRRCGIERIGWDKITDRLTLIAEAGDPGNPGHTLRLYDLPGELGDLYDDEARILLCSNASVDKGGHLRQFGLPVPARHDDPIDAAADLFGVAPAAYRQLARAT